MQLGEVLLKSTQFFKSKGSRSARLDAELLISHALNLGRVDLYLKFEQPLNLQELEVCRALVRRRGEGEPVAYILGYKDFYKSRFQVGPEVLIPRPETENLVELSLEWISGSKLVSPHILELGVGSGCVGLSIVKELPPARLWAIDISHGAIEVAKVNARLLGVHQRVMWRCEDADGFVYDGTIKGWQSEELPPGSFAPEAFDLIVANPPYVAIGDVQLEEDVRKFEPSVALFAGSRGLDRIVHWLSVAVGCVRPGGKVFFEIGSDQSELVLGLCKSNQKLVNPKILLDESKRPRVLSATVA